MLGANLVEREKRDGEQAISYLLVFIKVDLKSAKSYVLVLLLSLVIFGEQTIKGRYID